MPDPREPEPIDVSTIRESEPSVTDPRTSTEASVFTDQPGVEKAKLENEGLRIANRQAEQDRRQRKEYANKTFALIAVWLAFIAAVILMQGRSVDQFFLTDNVLLALIGSTTATVVGIFLIVVNYLFPKK